jgi:hypothetical protein
MDLLRHFLLEGRIDEALALQPAFALKDGCHDLYPEMRFPAWARARMAGVTLGFVDNLERCRVECGS